MRLISDEALAVATIWQEARGEKYEGKVAVAEVIRRRMKLKYSSDGTVAGTVFKAWQFSGWNTDDPNRIPALKLDDTNAQVKDCIKAWKESETTNLTNNAVLYCNRDLVRPAWAKESNKVAKIGCHTFFVDK